MTTIDLYDLIERINHSSRYQLSINFDRIKEEETSSVILKILVYGYVLFESRETWLFGCCTDDEAEYRVVNNTFVYMCVNGIENKIKEKNIPIDEIIIERDIQYEKEMAFSRMEYEANIKIKLGL